MSSPDRETLITDSQGQNTTAQGHRFIREHAKSQMPSVFQDSTMFSLSLVPA